MSSNNYRNQIFVVVSLLVTFASKAGSFQINIQPTIMLPQVATNKAQTKIDNKQFATNLRKERLSLSRNARKTSSFDIDSSFADTPNFGLFALFSIIGFLYWYGLPVPGFVPLKPGWPASDADFQPVLEDSYHFFYLSELLNNADAPYVIPPRLAVFNVVEAWIFAMLPALWKDKQRRLPLPVLLGSWLLLGINLTNAFLAPYLAITELRSNKVDPSSADDSGSASIVGKAFPRIFGAVASAVVAYALYQSAEIATSSDWSDFWDLIRTDRSYLAFCVDPVLFSIFQPILLRRVKTSNDSIDYVPFLGLVAW
eukprot:CAMPEP_0176152906 /NCGR_PEP_ID=MMETSP0120_2-20121206/78099_1 /TAXON_ID=160619 /ORGANISM="Kryptoperidinium foliaceum, Strain CCMP 1326" /LENGTH=311 /DNA_ID=CAMNT_0017489931 /DNA_START=54 /DNA_END=986 /DNA_ORIENTATION=+